MPPTKCGIAMGWIGLMSPLQSHLAGRAEPASRVVLGHVAPVPWLAKKAGEL